jgi:protocatechuate 3,4-dioxygenase alpha subunit
VSAPLCTPSQTVGPFFGFALPYDSGPELVGSDDPGAIRIEGRVLDGAGEPLDDAMLELWQANRNGRYAHPEDAREELPLEHGFNGFGRCGTDADGGFWFVTVKPGPVPANGGRMQAPHIDLSVFARGLLTRLVTRIYFPDERQANEADPVLSSIDDPNARSTLIAVPEGPGRLRFDVHLQGKAETLFFDV